MEVGFHTTSSIIPLDPRIMALSSIDAVFKSFIQVRDVADGWIKLIYAANHLTKGCQAKVCNQHSLTYTLSYRQSTQPQMAQTARALVAPKVGDPLEFHDVVLDSLRPDEVLVEIHAVGICHADISCLSGKIPVKFPHVFGHEGV